MQTAPRLPDGTPFPTLVLPDLPAGDRRDEQAGGGRRDAGDDRPAAADAGLRERYLAAHVDYLRRGGGGGRRRPDVEPLPPGTQSAGGMPDRVKCLHALAAHALAVPGMNPLGEEAVERAGEWWQAGPCVDCTGSLDA